MRPTAQRDEQGATAVIFAIMITVVLMVAALGVDLGNAMNRHKVTQTSADFAALAGANGLPSQTDALTAVADYLNKNAASNDGGNDCNPHAGQTVTTSMLTDGNASNGEVTFPATTRITVRSPAARVQFGLAAAGGFDDTCVSGTATAAIRSGSPGMAPYYATTACSTGPQVIKSDAGGPSIPHSVPPLSHDSETNSSVLSGTVTPPQLTLAQPTDPPSVYVTILGTNLDAANIDSVGFFNSDGTEPVISTTFSNQDAGSISVLVPTAVHSRQDVWWVRVHHLLDVTPPLDDDPHSDKWSARSEARPLIVGDLVLSCDPESSSGNFGSVDIPWGGNDLADLEKNIKDGLRPPTTLVQFPGPPFPADNACNTHAQGVISTDAVSRPNTNCLQMVTGLKASPAYDGYLKNPSGKLVQDTSALCMASPQNRPARRSMSTGESINDDTLSCFLKDDTLHLSDTVSYNGADGLFVPELWDSPRFTMVPIIDHDPSGTKWMPIIKFVPGFITDEVTGSSRQSPVFSGETPDGNGLVVQNPNKLRAIRIFFFDMDAMPNPPDGTPLQDWFGSGKKIPTLID